MEILGYLASFCIGLILGLIGGGGSLLAIPVLVYLFSVQVVEATTYSLIIVGITSMFGTFQRFRNSLVDIQTGLTFGVPSIVTIFITRKWLIPNIPDTLIQLDSLVISKRLFILALFSILVIGASYVMITKNIRPLIRFGDRKTIHLMTQGAVIGVLTGLVGIGGGFLILPALIFLAKLPFDIAVGTSLFIIAIKSLTGFVADVTTYSVNWSFLFIVLLIAIAGIITGNLYSGRCSHEKLKKSFGWFTLVIGISILVKESITFLRI
jgi:hypothetical protein